MNVNNESWGVMIRSYDDPVRIGHFLSFLSNSKRVTGGAACCLVPKLQGGAKVGGETGGEETANAANEGKNDDKIT